MSSEFELSSMGKYSKETSGSVYQLKQNTSTRIDRPKFVNSGKSKLSSSSTRQVKCTTDMSPPTKQAVPVNRSLFPPAASSAGFNTKNQPHLLQFKVRPKQSGTAKLKN